jgi:transposase
MEELVKLLCTNFEYTRHELIDGILYIHVQSCRQEAECPYCGTTGTRVHSRYERRFRDLPIQGNKVEIVLDNRKYFCKNPECAHKTFAESFECLPFKGKRSRRLTDSIVKLSLNVSSVTAAALLREGTADVGKSTICTLLKKGLSN